MRTDGNAGPGLAAVMLGLPGFVVLAAGEVGGELELLVETTETVTGCLGCGVVATAHGRRTALVRDIGELGPTGNPGLAQAECGDARRRCVRAAPGPRPRRRSGRRRR